MSLHLANHPRYLTATPGACVIALVLTLALGMSASPAQAVWSTTGNAAADSSSRDEIPHGMAIDGSGGVYIAFPYSETNNDSLAIQHLNSEGVKTWGSQGVRINPGGNGGGVALLEPDSAGGVWAAWYDTRAGLVGVYVQRFNSAGVAQLTAGGVRIFPRAPGSLDVATTSAGELLILVRSAGDSLFVQRVSAAGTREFSGDGILLAIEANGIFTFPNLMADGEGAVVTFPRHVVGGGSQAADEMWATRINSSGVKLWGASGVQVFGQMNFSATQQRATWTGSELFCSWELAVHPVSPAEGHPVRVQKLNNAGVPQWTAGGVIVHTPVSGSPFFQDQPVDHVLTPDGLGGCYVAWLDPRNYFQPAPNTFLHGDDIYGQRLDPTGAAMWTANGAPIDSAAGGLDRLQICTDAANGIFLCFTDFTFGDGDEDVRLRRVNGDSAPIQVFTAKFLNSISGSEDPSRERNQALIPDGAGGIFAAWEDGRNEGTSLSDVYATRRGANGNPFVPSITVLAPNGGESLASLRMTNIGWASTLGGNVKIEYSNGSFARTTIVTSTPDDGSFTWTPTVSGAALKIFVSDAADGSPIDSSDATFSVCPSLTAEQPYGNLVAANDLIEADLNEDGILDIVTATGAGAYVNLGLGTAGVGEGAWGAPTLVGTASSAQDVIADDFNDDGILDLAITTSSNGVQINFGNGTGGVGNGTFGSGATYAIGTPARGLVSLDADEDGIRDLAVANGGTSVSILLGKGSGGVGNGTFGVAADYTTGTTPTRLVAADFNEDGVMDLAVTCSGTTKVSVFIGNGTAGVGDGTFAAAVNYATGTSPLGLCTGDFNEDGILDLAVAHNSSATGIGTFRGLGAGGVGNGTFAPMVSVPVGATLRDVAVIDLDGDGIADLAATNQTSDRVYALFGLGSGNVGNGTFNGTGFEYGGDGPSQMIVADFQENDAPDVVTGCAASGSVTVLEGYCPTDLGTTITVIAPNGGQFLQAGANTTISWTKGAGVLAVDIELSRDGGVNWEPIATDVPGTSYVWTVTAPATAAARIRVRDSQLQNRLDISNTNFGIFTSATLSVLSPDGGETIPTISTRSIQWAGNSGGSVRIDLTWNGGTTRVNLISATTNDGQYSWPVENGFYGSGFRILISLVSDSTVADSSDATFSICPRYVGIAALAAGASTVALTSADFNEDGIDDLAGATGGDDVLISLGGGAAGVGDGSFATHNLFVAGPGVSAVAVGDLNRDGRLDLVAATDNGAAVLLGNGTGDVGDGTFGAPTTFSTGGNCSDVELADLNEDGILDIVAANGDSANIAVLLGQGTNGVGTGGFAARVTYSAQNGPGFLALNDFNHDGILDVAVSCSVDNRIVIRLGQGAGGVGNGTFGPSTSLTTNQEPTDLLTGDFNEGGTVDLVVRCFVTIQTFEGDGSGGFTLTATDPVAVGSITEMSVFDFNGDAFPDLLLTNTTRATVDIYPNGSGPEFNLLGSARTLSNPNCVAPGDFDEDGVLDLVLGCGTNIRPLAGGACTFVFDGSIASVLPAGGEAFVPGTNHTISWTKGVSVHAVNVELSRDAGRNWEIIARNVIGNSIDWTVTRPVTDSALVRVRDSQIASRNDVTGSVFRITDVLAAEPGDMPVAASFSRPWPNPVRDVVRFEMALPRDADVTVEAYDVSGRMVHTLARGHFAAGRHPLRWGGAGATKLPAGVYFVRARWEGFDSVQRVVRLE